MSDYLYVNDGDVEAMSVDPDCGGKNPVLSCQCAKCTDWRIKMSGGKLDVMTQREKLAIENRRSDVREFLEDLDADQVQAIYDDCFSRPTKRQLIESIMGGPQAVIDRIWRNEGLSEPETPEEEKASH